MRTKSIEDEVVLRRLATNGLTRFGYRVLSASDGDAALRMMSGIDGVELAERVRARWPSTRILFTSGFAGDRLAARGLGSDDELSLQKPFSLRELGDRVRAVLDKPHRTIPK